VRFKCIIVIYVTPIIIMPSKFYLSWCLQNFSITEVNIVILNWQRPLWEGTSVVKRSGRDEPMWVVIHMCMEAALGISLCS
jgi:hypothetical protein